MVLTGSHKCLQCGKTFEWECTIIPKGSIITYYGKPNEGISSSEKIDEGTYKIITNCPYCSGKDRIDYKFE